MTRLARLGRFVGALIGALLRRRPRRSRTAIPPLGDPAVAPAASGPGSPIGESSPENAPSATEEQSVAVAPPLPRAETERQAAPSSEYSPSANFPRPEDPNSETTAGAVGRATAPTAALPQGPTHGPVIHDPSLHTVEPAEPVVALTPDARADATAVPEVLKVDEPPPEAAALETSLPIDDAVASSSDAARETEAEAAPVIDDPNEARSKPESEEAVLVHRSPAPAKEPDLDAPSGLDGGGDPDGAAVTPLDDSGSGGDVSEPRQAQRPASQRRQSTWERRPEPSTEYTVVALPPPSDDYRAWNRAIAEHLLLKSTTGSERYLTITPRILARALAETQGLVLNAEDAQAQFANAVSQSYRARILTNRARLRVLRRNGDDGVPECIGFLALTVLAAYRMHGDDEATGLAYYLRLGELLQCGLSGQYPEGFDPLVFESLWHFLRDWLAKRDLRLALPSPEDGTRRFVGLPLAHVPLRSLDIEKLPAFFVWAGYQPSSEVTADRLAGDFARWVRSKAALTPAGVAAFADARRNAVLAEIRAELDSWDGTCDESVGRRSAPVEILFDPVQHRPELFYAPRRPSGFPTRFDDGVHVFEGVDEGWYGRIAIAPADGPELVNGFNWRSAHSGVEFVLRRAATSVISMAPGDDHSGFMSARGLRRNVQCAVLCQEDVVETVVEYLSHVSERACRPLRHQDLPAGWSLFTGVVARRLADAPAGLESLDVQANIGLIPSGGIRLGNRWSWLHGAPPRIIVTGTEPGLPVTVDGSPADVDENGMLRCDGALTRLGAHVIQIGPVRRNVEIVEPSIHVSSSQSTSPDGESAPVMLALPPGRWTVVGATPGQVTRPQHTLRGGTIVACAFSPAWAIRVGSGRGATVLNVLPGPGVPPPPEIPRGKRMNTLAVRDMFDWTSSIYDAAVRHPRIERLTGEHDPAAARASWKTYARCAGDIKRMIRRSQR